MTCVSSWQNSVSLYPASIFTQGQTCQLCQVSLDLLLLHSSLLYWKRYLFQVLVLEGLVSLLRTSELQLLQHLWLGHRPGLLWCWIICLGKEPSSLPFLRLHQVLRFRLLLTVRAALFLLKDSFHSSRYWSSEFHWSIPIHQCSLLPSPTWPLQFTLLHEPYMNIACKYKIHRKEGLYFKDICSAQSDGFHD